MPDIEQATQPEPVTVTVDIGVPVEVVFDANRITPRWLKQYVEREEALDPLSISVALAGVILSWNMTKADQPYEPTTENIAVLSFANQKRVMDGLLEAVRPTSEEGNDSRNTSSIPTAGSSSMPESLPNGGQPSSSVPSSVSPFPT